MTTPNYRDEAIAVAEELVGTAKDLQEVATPDQWASNDFCTELDQHVLCCTQCSWWHEPSEMVTINDQLICEDCANENDDE